MFENRAHETQRRRTVDALHEGLAISVMCFSGFIPYGFDDCGGSSLDLRRYRQDDRPCALLLRPRVLGALRDAGLRRR